MVTRSPPAGDSPTSTSPPWARTTILAMVRPRPEPPVSRLREPSTLKKGRNTSSFNSSGMPGPRSSIRIMVSLSQTARLAFHQPGSLRDLSESTASVDLFRHDGNFFGRVEVDRQSGRVDLSAGGALTQLLCRCWKSGTMT